MLLHKPYEHSYAQQKKIGKPHRCQHKYTSQNHKTDRITAACFSFIHQVYSTWETGLNCANGET